jgi:hypothetical protein
MPFAICRATAPMADAAAALNQSKVRWVRFGRDLFCHADEASGSAWEQIGARNAVLLAAPLRHWDAEAEEDFYLVTQEGRLFQQAYPDIPVLYDKGRHLVVRIDRRRAAAMPAHAARFRFRPLKWNETVFEAAPRPPITPAADPHIAALLDKISRRQFVATVSELGSYPTRHSLSAHFKQAAQRARDRLQLMGYDVRLQNVPLPAGETVNVIADKRGQAGGERPVVLVTAHLDSINHPADHTLPDDPTAPAPGADDNASGSAGTIEIARIFSQQSTRHDLRLILFGGEEQGLRGSEHYVQQLAPSERARIDAVVNMDMIAVLNAAPPTVLLEGSPLSQDVITQLAAAAHAYTRLEVNTSLDPHDSDHCSFIDAGVPAVLTIEGSDGSNAMVHTANDTLDRLNHDLAIEILRMNVAFIAQRTGT